jgi:signal transduction histidine kinase
MNAPVLWIGAAALLAAVGIVVVQQARTRRMLRRMQEMLEAAMDGDFSESAFDESEFSALESRLARFLAASTVSARHVRAERDETRTLIADISHQTKTPLSNILLYTQLLEERDLPADCREALEALENQAEKLRFLIESLVKLSRLETGIISVTPVPNAVSSLLRAAGEQIALKAARKGVSLTVEPCEIIAVFDSKWTGEALYNLVDNAVKYTPPGGHVTLSAVEYELFCRIDVADTGIGVAEAEQGQIFQRFYRSPAVAEEEGVGVGLFLARSIVSAQGGYLKLSSELGRGSTFSLFLPRHGKATGAQLPHN